MSKKDLSYDFIRLLAYFHRFGWFAVLLLCCAVWREYTPWFFCVASFIFSVWSFVGYKLKWKHIYCSFQNACRERMTPNRIHWYKMKKGDIYGVPLFFFISGIVLLILLLCS